MERPYICILMPNLHGLIVVPNTQCPCQSKLSVPRSQTTVNVSVEFNDVNCYCLIINDNRSNRSKIHTNCDVILCLARSGLDRGWGGESKQNTKN